MRKKMGTSFIIYVILLLSFIGLYLVNSCSSIKWDLITSNSMEPTLMTNSLVCTDYTVPYEDIEIGDIIRYTEKSITDREIMHRVYQKTELPNGEIILAKGKVGGMEHLYDELKAGYWVFAFFYSTDFYEFKRFETEEDALTYYKSLTRDCFCGQKLLLKVGEAREGLM